MIYSVRNLKSHYICFYLNDCSSPVDSFEAAATILNEFASNDCCSMIDLNSAKGSSYYSLCSALDNPGLEVMYDFIQEQPLDYSKQIVNEIKTITLEEVKDCIRTIYLKLVSIQDTCLVLTCSDDKVQEYMEDFEKMGYIMEEKKYESL